MIESIKITSLTNIGSNLSYTSIFPVVNVSGSPFTNKANLQIIGNYILSQAGGANMVQAAQATLAQAVVNSAQPNITSVGTLSLSTLHISGGTNGQYLQTNGSGNLAWVSGGGSGNGVVGGSNTQIQFNNAGSFGGNANFVFNRTTGNVTVPGNINSAGDLTLSAGLGNGDWHFTFGANGLLTTPSNVNLQGARLNIGPLAATISTLVNPTIVIANSASTYIQGTIINTNGNGSADLTAEGAGADETQAFTDMGFAGHSFNDPSYTATAPGDGYLFVQGYANGIGGNMVLATGDYGDSHDIVFATGGFAAENEFARIDDANNVFHLTRDGSGIQFADGTIQTTAGGGGSTGNLAFTTNVMYSLGGVTVNNSDLTHGSTAALILPSNGNATAPVQVTNSYGNVILTAGASPGTLKNWTFDTTGNLTLPGNTFAVNYANGQQVPLAGSYGNSNVAAYLPTYTGNIGGNVVTANLFSGNGSSLSAIAGANVSGFVPNANVANTAFAVAAANVSGLGNIATINLTGSSSNVLYGNGVFAAVTGSGGSELVNGGNSFVLDADGNVVFEGNVAGQGINRGLVWDYGANANGINSQVRQDNGGLSVRAWTTDGGGANGSSAPVRIVTNQDATLNEWVFDGDGNLTLAGNLRIPAGNIVSDFIAPAFNSEITGITTGNATVIVTIADSPFEGPVQGQVTISSVTGTTEANGIWYYEAVEGDQFELYTDGTYTTPIDGTSWTPYVSGGTAVSIGAYSNLTIQGGNVLIKSNDQTWNFSANGALSIPNDIISNNTIEIDNRASGNTADIIIYSADDITLQARDRPVGATAEGGDINIFAGDSAEDSDTSAGDVVIEAGDGGASNLDFGGAGGFIRIEAGLGGAASTDANGFSALSGGQLTLTAGDGGTNNGNIDRGASGGDVSINAGDSTGNGQIGGDIILTTGLGGANALAGNVQVIIPSSDIGTGGTWAFNGDGSTIYPTLTVTRGDRSGTLTGQTLLFGDSTREAIITTPNGTNDINASQRFVINPGAGAANTSGEGGDIYLYAGRGGDAGGSGGDIKIRGGLAPVDGTGGYLDIQGGDTQGNGTGGYIDIRGGESGNAIGGAVNLYGGYGPTFGGNVTITGGQSGTGDGGNVTITGGVGGNGLPTYGNVNIAAGASTWKFDNTGLLTVPGEGVIRSVNDTIILESYNTANTTAYKLRLGDNGGVYLEIDTNEPWLTFTNDSGDAEIGAAPGAAGTGNAGYDLFLFGGSADTSAYGTGAGGNIQLRAGYGAGNDGGGGGPGGWVNIIAGDSTDPAGVSGNVTINSSNNIWTFDNAGNLTLPGNAFSVNYANGDPVTFGAAALGNVTFSNVTVQGDNNALNLSAGADFTANLAYLQVRAGDVASHIHFDTGNSDAYDLYIGNDGKYVQVSSTGNIIMSSYDGNVSYAMTLDTTGNLILPNGSSIIRSVGNSSLDPLNPNVSTMIFTPDPGYSSQSLVLDPTAPGHIHLRAPGANIDEPSANIFLGGEESSFEVGYYTGSAPNLFIHSGNNTWTFDNTGSFVFPGAGVTMDGQNNSLLTSGLANVTIGTFVQGADGGVSWEYQGDGSGNSSYGAVGLDTAGTANTANLQFKVQLVADQGNVSTNKEWIFNTAGNLTAPGAITATGKIGYANGGTATQTGTGQGVTLNQLTGQITLAKSSWNVGDTEVFNISCNKIANTDYVMAQVINSSEASFFNTVAYPFTPVANSIRVQVTAVVASTATPVVQYLIMKAATS